jgi:hypothetical protein
MSTGAIIDNFLLISQVAEIRTNDRSELWRFPNRLSGSGEARA